MTWNLRQVSPHTGGQELIYLSQAFQDSNGRMVNGDKLVKLRLTDMAKEKYSDDYPLAPIHIPFTELSRILDFAKAQPEGSSP